MSQRFTTPPPSAPRNSELNLTPEQVKQFELHRLKAKAIQRQREQEASSSTSTNPNANNKRPLGVTAANSTSPTAPGHSKKAQRPMQRDSRLGNYFEYDLSKMVNSKGGFLVADDKEVDEEHFRKEKERERQRVKQNLEERKCRYLPECTICIEAFITAVYLDQTRNPKCHECQSIDIDHTYRKIFSCLVCKKCQNEKPEKYSLLTKTECIEVSLLDR